jgi:two-component system, OmpR family, response regulator CpxR
MERLLLVDDDVELCEILTEYFSAEGFEVESAHDGVRGLERARSGKHALVILAICCYRVCGGSTSYDSFIGFERSGSDPHRAWS